MKLIQQLRHQSALSTTTTTTPSPSGRLFREITLDDPIRYNDNDAVESWLFDVLCLDASSSLSLSLSSLSETKAALTHDRDSDDGDDGSKNKNKNKNKKNNTTPARHRYTSYLPRAPVMRSLPSPSQCSLYYVNRDTLFSFHSASEVFLQRIMALYVSSHYKNSPNDVQMIADHPSHALFVLLPPVDEKMNALPHVLCVMQVAFEGMYIYIYIYTSV